MTRQLGSAVSIALAASILASGQVTTPASSSTEKTFVGTAESVTGTEQEVTGRLVVTTGNKSDFMAKEQLQVKTQPPQQVAAVQPEPTPAPEPAPAPAPRPAVKHKELPRTDSPLPFYALLGAMLLAVSALARQTSRA
jgi:hypothetical protein